MRTPRPVAIAAVLAVVAAACGTARDVVGEVGDAASQLASEAVTELQTIAPGGGDQPGGDASGEATASEGSGGDASGTDQPGGDDTSGAAATPTDDLGRVGANGRAMLRGDHATLVVEVDVQQDLQPSQAALAHMVDQLTQHADKPGGVQFVGGNTFASDRTAWTAQDIRDVAAANRSTSSSADTVSLYLVYVKGGFQSDGQESAAVGVTIDASEIAVFPERWSGLGNLVGSDQRIEQAVLTHELGHALGLVNLGYTSDIDHEDGDHPGHSSSRGSVMFWAVETDLIGQVFSGPPPDTFDGDDAADLEGLRTGRY